MTDQRPDDAAGGQEMKARLARLSQDLDAHNKANRPAGDTNAPGPGNLGSAMNMGFRVMSEFVAAIIVSALIGWQVDRWLGTSPLILILFVALGTAAGFWTVYRTATKGH